MLRRLFLYTTKVKFEDTYGGTYTELFRVLANSESEAQKMVYDYFMNGEINTGWIYKRVLSVSLDTSSDVIVDVNDGKVDINEKTYLDETNN